MNAQLLAKAAGCGISVATSWVDYLNASMAHYSINTAARQAAFLGQICTESANLTQLSENTNYSEAGLMATFPSHFHGDAILYAHQAVKIANRVYANRLGNGDEASGDGWKYRGGGLIQLTFKDNYQHYGTLTGHDIVSQPYFLRTASQECVDVAACYWESHGCNALADKSDYVAITKEINGGQNEIDSRIANTHRALEALKNG